MRSAFDLAWALAAIGGHFALVVFVYNRLHALAWPRRTIKVADRLLLSSACVLALIFLLGGPAWFSAPYQIAGWLMAVFIVPCWLIPKLRERRPAALLSNDTAHSDVANRLGFAPVHGAEARWLASFPRNQLLQIAVQQKTLQLQELPPELDGLTIAHLSDLHMTGKLGREFYDVIVDETNALNADLVVITGDILENEKCLPWIMPTLGRLRARCGRFFILGNHELKLKNVQPLRDALGAAGLVDLGGRCIPLTINRAPVEMAGNELPWFGTAPALPALSTESPGPSRRPFRILLSHTPDQLPWAQQHGFQLMLAGHNHGGQIRLPYLGALITPSRYGSRYAGGLYDEPPTLMHVSRGLGSARPIRLNCPPELALLILRSVGH